MAENNKKREWVKTAIIVFLTIMLLLTFFSNTIMNYSLPEVSAQYVSGGTISEQIRGTAVVEAAESYSMKINQTRVISTVEVKRGDAVEKGQVIARFEESEMPDLEKAKNELEEAENAYRKMLLSTGEDYSLEELAIANLEEDIKKDREDLKNISKYQKKYEEAKKKVKSAQEKVTRLEKDEKEYEAQLALARSDSDTDLAQLDSSYYNQIKNAKNNYEKYEKMKKEADDRVDEIKKSIMSEDDSAASKKLQNQIDKLNKTIIQLEIKADSALADGDDETYSSCTDQIIEYQAQVKDLQADYDAIMHKISDNYNNKNQLTYAQANQKTAEAQFDEYKKKLENTKAAIIKDITSKRDKASEALEKAKEELKDAEEAAEEAKNKASLTVEEAEKKITEKERELEVKKITLAKAQKKDLESAGSSEIDIEAKQKEIEKIKKNIEKLEKDSSEGEIKAQVSGVIDNICAAGETVENGSVIAVIQMTEKGYSANISVTSEQARKVKVGEQAEIQYFWFGDAAATLTAIKADPSDPQKKQLVFSVTGDVTPGQSLQLVMGGRGQQYEFLVPNSAIREDNNGKFLLTVISKSSPLGNRYIAQRIDIQVLASDDKTSAVSGEIMQSDFIISTSTKPIKPGDQVRLVDK